MQIEGIPTAEVHKWITQALTRGSPLLVIAEEARADIADRIRRVAAAVREHASDAEQMVSHLMKASTIDDPPALVDELKRNPIKKSTHVDEQEEPVETAGMLPAVALMTIVGSKGLSARHVIVLGCDDVNMKVGDLAFFVALTRARESLHLVVAAHSGGAKQAHNFVFDLPENCCDYLSFRKTDGVLTPLGGSAGLRKYFEKLAWVSGRG